AYRQRGGTLLGERGQVPDLEQLAVGVDDHQPPGPRGEVEDVVGDGKLLGDLVQADVKDGQFAPFGLEQDEIPAAAADRDVRDGTRQLYLPFGFAVGGL